MSIGIRSAPNGEHGYGCQGAPVHNGHSEIDVTMNIYTHMGYERASYQMLKLVDGAGKEDNRIISMAQTDAT